MFEYMETNEVEIDFRELSPYTEKQIKADKLSFKEKILDIDLAALGTALENTMEFAQKTQHYLQKLKNFTVGKYQIRSLLIIQSEILLSM